ncbi:restriction endonuclease subunit S [Bordetella sp. FB-8]|uniref:restriction endonuclease subunit S n=1 Tax=Bordetella sp. FB-8 TaxID=1159870 RepID=UPI0009DA7F20|nr:restriction endonuclease subunit S [Bordetella sp. FB-8]
MLLKGWKRSTLGECTKLLSGNTPSKERQDYWSGDFPWVTVKDMKTPWLHRTGLTLTQTGKAAASVAPANSILVVTRGMALLKDLPISLAMRDVAFNQDIKAIVPNQGLDARFLAYQLQSKKHAVLDMVDTAGHGTGKLDTDLLKSVDLVVPPIPEQRRIAQILSTWDQAIATIERLGANSLNQKLLLSQQMLTGKVRLRSFNASGQKRKTPYGSLPLEWGYRRIGDVATEVSQKLGEAAPYRVLSCTKHQGLVDSLSYFNKQVFSIDTSTYKVVPRGYFVYATNHIDEGSIGHQNLYDFGLVSPMYTVFKATDKVVDAYLFALLKTEHYRQIFASATNASVDRRGSLRWKDFRNLHIPLPSIEEQQAIAKVLTEAGREADLLQAQLALLREEKAALMSQLFTGKRRVKLPDAETEVQA